MTVAELIELLEKQEDLPVLVQTVSVEKAIRGLYVKEYDGQQFVVLLLYGVGGGDRFAPNIKCFLVPRSPCVAPCGHQAIHSF